MKHLTSPAFKLIVLVSWFWLTLILITINIFLNRQLLAERARNDQMQKNIDEIEKQLPTGRVILELKK